MGAALKVMIFSVYKLSDVIQLYYITARVNRYGSAEKYAVRPQIEEYSTCNNIHKKRGSRNIFLKLRNGKLFHLLFFTVFSTIFKNFRVSSSSL